MTVNKGSLFDELLGNFLNLNESIESVIVSDREGFIIAGQKKEDVNMELVSVLSTLIEPILGRIRFEFNFEKFGSCSFETDEHRLLFVSVNETTMLSVMLNPFSSVEEILPYGYYLAEKISQIINPIENEFVQLSIPNFKHQAKVAQKMKGQLYQLSIDENGLYRFKFIIIGDHTVGKTSIVRRFVENRFLADYRTTIGLNIVSHKFESFGNKIHVNLWDIGPQEYFKKYRKTYYNGTQAAFIAFDLTSRKSFQNVERWHRELIEHIENKDLPVMIIGNKRDLVNDRVVSHEEGVKLSDELSERFESSISYIETSALTGENIEDAFKLISYYYIIKCKEIEEKRRSEELLSIIDTILRKQDKLRLAFVAEDPIWDPALQILVEAYKNEELVKSTDNDGEKFYEFRNGLILKNCIFFLKEIWDSDGVLVIFDAREKTHVDPRWNYILTKIINYLGENKVLVVGIRITKEHNWTQLIEEFEIDIELERKMASIMFFKIGKEYQSEIYNQLISMLHSIDNSIDKKEIGIIKKSPY